MSVRPYIAVQRLASIVSSRQAITHRKTQKIQEQNHEREASQTVVAGDVRRDGEEKECELGLHPVQRP